MSSSVPCAPSNRMDWPSRIACAEHQRDVAHPRPEPLGVLAQLVEDGFRVHGGVLDQPIAGVDVVADFLLEAGVVGQVADANAAARDLVFVGRPDAARRRADLALAAPGFRQQVEVAVIRQDHVRLVADDDAAADVDAGARRAHLLRRRAPAGSTTTPLPMTQVTPGCRMPDGIRRSTNFRAVDVHRVPGVVSALIPGHDRKVRRDQVDDLAFAFIAPLRTEDREVHIELRFYFVTADHEIETLQEIFESVRARASQEKKVFIFN